MAILLNLVKYGEQMNYFSFGDILYQTFNHHKALSHMMVIQFNSIIYSHNTLQLHIIHVRL